MTYLGQFGVQAEQLINAREGYTTLLDANTALDAAGSLARSPQGIVSRRDVRVVSSCPVGLDHAELVYAGMDTVWKRVAMKQFIAISFSARIEENRRMWNVQDIGFLKPTI